LWIDAGLRRGNFFRSAEAADTFILFRAPAKFPEDQHGRFLVERLVIIAALGRIDA